MRVNLDPTINRNGNQLLKTVLAGAFALLVVTTLVNDDKSVEKVEADYYCEMVHLWITTNGESGYPDYRNLYNDNCNLNIAKR